ncbi:calcium-binding protein [Inquilinus sp. NPDC058860]|uniref:calcium-binding protein n=1 Tax=Inquilinus sp. NPDC058860 TaxID=3346652 RepID=UPI0036B20C17
MADINGTNGNDFIHRADDSTPTPPGYTEIEGTGDEPDTVNGLGGDDIVFASVGTDTINGGDGNDSLSGQEQSDIVQGDAGNDTVVGGAAADQVFGDAGADTLYGDFEFVSGTGSADTVSGGDGDDRIYGGGLTDTLAGGNDNDAFLIRTVSEIDGRAESMDGGAGTDRLEFEGAGGTVNLVGAIFTSVEGLVLNGQTATLTAAQIGAFLTISGSAATDQIVLAAAGTVDLSNATVAGIDAFIGSAGNDILDFFGVAAGQRLEGGGGDDDVLGGSGVDTLIGGAGDDMLRGRAGADILDGGDGSDFANFQQSGAAVTVDLLAGSGSGGDAQGDQLSNIENLYGSSHDDQLTGNDIRNIIGGELGDDTLAGNGGDDSLSGEAGDDGLDGGDGNDRLVGGAGIDTARGGIGNDSVDAGSDDDRVFGEAGDDMIVGGAGHDEIDGGDGNDIIEAGADADTIIGGAGIDTASYAGSAEAVTVSLQAGAGTFGDAGGDTLTGVEQVIGSAFADNLAGDAGANTLWGGAGNDRFVYSNVNESTVAASGKDTITDVSTGDRIDLSAIDADGNDANGDTAFTFGAGGFTGAAGELRIVAFGDGRQGVYLDVDGDRTQDAPGPSAEDCPGAAASVGFASRNHGRLRRDQPPCGGGRWADGVSRFTRVTSSERRETPILA